MSDPEWTLYYHPCAGRGEFVRIMFEEAGVEYKEVNTELMENIMSGKDTTFPVYAPPVIKSGNFTLSQTPVICKYLGKRYGMFPDNDTDVWHADQVNSTIHDYMAEGCLVFHGKSFVGAYNEQKEETKPYIEWFVKDRIDKWLNHLEKCLLQNNSGKGFVIGDKLTYVDLGLFQILRATESQFTEKWKSMDKIPLLKAFKQRIETRPRLVEYFKSDRCRAFEGNSMM